MSQPDDETLRKIRELVSRHPEDVSRLLEKLEGSIQSRRDAVRYLVEIGDLSFDNKMRLVARSE